MNKTPYYGSMANIQLLSTYKDLDGNDCYGGSYGPHLLLDCHGCNTKKFNRTSIKQYMKRLVKAIKMDAEDFHFWDDEDVPEDKKQTAAHATGTTIGGVIKKKIGIQFIITSSIVIHTLDILERVYVDIFSCQLFDDCKAKRLTQEFFKASSIRDHLIVRT